MAVKDKYGRHELLDRSGLLLDCLQEWIIDHGGLKKSEHVTAEEARVILWRLYQEISANTIQNKDLTKKNPSEGIMKKKKGNGRKKPC